jgi:hypothetical protein
MESRGIARLSIEGAAITLRFQKLDIPFYNVCIINPRNFVFEHPEINKFKRRMNMEENKR